MKKQKDHESYGKIRIAKFNGDSIEFFGSDLAHNSGFTIQISRAYYEDSRGVVDHVFRGESLIEVKLSSNQFIDAITSGMNTDGVPCTITNISYQDIDQISHVVDRKESFSNDLEERFSEYFKRIDDIVEIVSDGKIPKNKKKEILFELGVLKSHIKSNTVYTMDCFNESMYKTITEAKQSISNYVDSKIMSLGVESMRKELHVNIEPKRINEGK